MRCVEGGAPRIPYARVLLNFPCTYTVSKVVAPGPHAGRERGSPRAVLAPGTAQEGHRLTTGPCRGGRVWWALCGAG